jgi:preprotein translocase subunit SecA
MFEDLMHDIQSTFTERFLKIQVSAEAPRPEPQRRVPPPVMAEPVGAEDLFTGPARRVAPPAASPAPHLPAPALSSSMGPVGRATAAVPEVGRNDPCPCGSGRKYKKCHGAGR